MDVTDSLLTAREGAAVLQVSIPTFWRRVADGTEPKPVKIGALSRWPRSEIIGVIENAKALRVNESPRSFLERHHAGPSAPAHESDERRDR